MVETDYPRSQAVHTSEQLQANFEKALRTRDEFTAGEAPVQKAARRIARALDELEIPYAVAGGLAVAANGLDRQTVDVDLILTKEGLTAFKERWLGRGWVEQFQGSNGLQDTENGLRIDIRTTDGRPGDGKSCPFKFPHPETIGQRFGGVWSGMRMLDLRTLIELKIASWMTAPHRPRDMDDVIRLIKIHELQRTYSTGLQKYVRREFDRLWELAQVKDPYDE